MPDSKPQLQVPHKDSLTATGAADRFRVVLIEATGALGVLVAERCCPNETLERVLYFRALMGEPHARFFESVQLLTIDGFSVARVTSGDALFFEPSAVPYAVGNMTESQYTEFVDNVVAYRCGRAEQLITSLFAQTPGFSLDPDRGLITPPDYATAMDHFVCSYPFVEPNEPSRPTSQ
jgi:hypothetical protein